MLKKMVIEFIDWVMYKLLSTRQREFISHLFSDKQKQFIKKVIKPGKKRSQLQKIERVKYRLYNLGFTERGVDDLYALYQHGTDPYLRRLAAWELALWYANQYSEDGARKCLAFLPDAVRGVKDRDVLRAAAILEAECYDLLGEIDKGKQLLAHVFAEQTHADLYLARANLASSLTERLKWINKALALHELLPLTLNATADCLTYDRLSVEIDEQKQRRESAADAKVSVIIPAYNAEDVIRTSLGSVLAQTWANLEVLVVDDCSSDSTPQIVEEHARQDDRVRLIKAKTNGGAYVARNLALQEATGEFVTINDADDWSHPQKIEQQVLHLQQNPKVMGNTSQQARATNDLKFYRRGKPGLYLFSNMSSFMFRRRPVMEAIGFWDSVRFGGDSELIKRMKKVFGDRSVVEVPTGPLSFQRQTETSLTGHSAFGFPGYFMGARQEYAEAHEHFHEQVAHEQAAVVDRHERTERRTNGQVAARVNTLRYSFPQEKRPFPIPEPMWPVRENKPSGHRHFDVVIASEFRLLGGNNMSNIEEIKAQKKMGLRTGLMQMSRYDLNSVERMNPKVRDMVDGDRVQMIVYGEKVSCDVLIVRHPPVLEEWQKYIPDVQAGSVHVIVNQPPKKEYSAEGETIYHIERCAAHMRTYFGQVGTWHPIGPQVRATLHEHHAEDLTAIDLSSEDWVNIINVQEWRRPSRPAPHSKIRIGRHSRPQYVKWPSDPEQLLAIYPDSDEYEVHVLGGADVPRKILGSLPANWHVHEFGEMDPKDFLAQLDVFVYYTHPDWVESFGRVIFEAMAVGVPVIVPPIYHNLFGDAALYAEPADVQQKIKWLMNDDDAYVSQVKQAHDYVEQHFGYAKHASRLGGVLLDVEQ